MTNEEVWALVLNNERLLKREVLRYAGKRLLEEAYSDVVIGRAIRIMRTFDETRNVKPITHLCANVRWYAFKWSQAQRRVGKSRREPLYDNTAVTIAKDDNLEVNSILEQLPQEVAEILRWRFVDGFTLEELSAHYGRGVTWVRRRCATALNYAQQMHRDCSGEQDVQEMP